MAFESLFPNALFKARPAGKAHTGQGHAYSEQAFRQLLAIERKRAQHSTRSFLLLLVSVKNGRESRNRIEPEEAEVLFLALALTLRETDFVGWYRQGRIAAAVLAQAAEPVPETLKVVAERVATALCSHLPPNLCRRLKVRLVPLRRTPKV